MRFENKKFENKKFYYKNDFGGKPQEFGRNKNNNFQNNRTEMKCRVNVFSYKKQFIHYFDKLVIEYIGCALLVCINSHPSQSHSSLASTQFRPQM